MPPRWVEDRDKWQKAKEMVGTDQNNCIVRSDPWWASVASVYQRDLGGKVNMKAEAMISPAVTTTANVATFPVPLGMMLKRTSPMDYGDMEDFMEKLTSYETDVKRLVLDPMTGEMVPSEVME